MAPGATHSWRAPLLVLVGSVLVHALLMTVTPAFSFDEGVYVARALRFAGSGSLYSSSFWDHPFLGWAILGISFKALGFPGSVVEGTTGASLFPLLWSVPRGIMVAFTLVGSYLVYQIALRLFHDRRAALISLALICFAPLSGYFRMVLLDNIANVFLLAALWLCLESRDRKHRHVLAALSGMAYGSTLLTKLSFLAFLPVFPVAFVAAGISKAKGGRPGRGHAAIMFLAWLMPAIGLASIWPLYAWSEGNFDGLVQTQLWQAHRSAGLAFWQLFGYFVYSDPILSILGLAGLSRAVKQGEWTLATWGLSYLAFLALIGVRFDYYLIPLGAPLAISTSVYLTEGALPSLLATKILAITGRHHLWMRVGQIAIPAVVVVSVIAYGLSTTPSAAGPQEQAYKFVVSRAPSGSLVVASPAYDWIMGYDRKDLRPVDWYGHFPGMDLKAQHIILIVDFHFKSDMAIIPLLRELYGGSTLTARFGEGYGLVEVRTVR